MEGEAGLVIVGLLTGGLEIVGEQGLITKTNQVHEGGISEVKSMKKGGIITVGSDQRIVISTVYLKDKKIVKLQEIRMELTVKTLLLA